MATVQEKERRLSECFNRGQHLAKIEKNYDYAHAMFAECLGQAPGNPIYAEALIENLKAKFDNDPKNARHFLGLRGEREFNRAIAAEDWQQALRLGFDVLKADPWYVQTLRAMARACQALHYNEVELLYLKQALQAAPKDVEVNRHCAHSLARMGQFDQAIACWHRVEEISGGNKEAAQMILKLAEEKIYFGGRIGKSAAVKKGRVATTETEVSETMEQSAQRFEPVAVPLTPQQRFERGIKDDPADVANYLKLSEVLCDMGYFEKAEEILQKALGNCAQLSLVQEAQQKVLAVRKAAIREAAEIERQKQLRAERSVFRIPWLESILLAAGVLLLFQIFPAWWDAISTKLVEHGQVLLVVLNMVVLALLILWRKWIVG